MEHTDELCRLTKKCSSLFTAMADHPKLSDDDWLEDRAADFAWWSHGLKAQKTGRSSLDFRLRNRLDIQKVISGLLHSLFSALEEYLHSCADERQELSCDDPPPHKNETDEELSDSDDSASDSPWSEFSDEETKGKAKTTLVASLDSDDSGPKFFITTNLNLLARMSIAIRRSGAKLRYLKADEYLKTHMDDNEYMELRKHLFFLIQVGPYEQRLLNELGCQVSAGQLPQTVEIVIRAWIFDPSRITPIQQQLIETNVTRRNRIVHARRMFDKDALTKPGEGPPISQMSEAPLPPIIQPEQVDLNKRKPNRTKSPGQPSSQHVESTRSWTATELGSRFVLPNILPSKAKETQSIVTKMTRTGFKQDYPPCPTHQGSFQCPYCVQVLPEEYLSKWRWRGHVAQDLNPYSCVYGDCPDSQELYATKDEWIKHITTQHSTQRWTCDQCTLRGDLSEDLVFDDETDWEQHMSTCHRGEFIDSQLALLLSLSRRRLTEPIQCPLCNRPAGPVRPDQDDHVAEHLHSWALIALPWDLHTKDQHSSDSPDLGSSNDLARLSNMSEFSEDNQADGETDIKEKLKHEIISWIYESPMLHAAFANRLKAPFDSLSRFLLGWATGARPDEQNETLLQHLMTINQTVTQLSRHFSSGMDLDSQQNNDSEHLKKRAGVASKAPQQSPPESDAETDLEIKIETALEYLDTISVRGRQKQPHHPHSDDTYDFKEVSGPLSNTTFPKVDGEDVPISDTEREELLLRDRIRVVQSKDSSERLLWARDVLMWEKVAERNWRIGIDVYAEDPHDRGRELRADAMDIISSLSEQGHPEALYLKGLCLEYGQLGNSMDIAEASVSYRQAASLGHGRSEFQLGWLQAESGEWATAVNHYRKALTLGDSAAKFSIGWMYLNGYHGHTKDEARGLALIKEAADSADEDAPLSAYMYGMLLARRLGGIEITESSFVINPALAIKYIAKSAYLGSALGQFTMGIAYEREEFGCNFDPGKSLHYHQLAARRGLPEAEVSLSRWFLLGYGNLVPRNEELAFKYAWCVASSNLPDAKFLMGCYYEFGISVDRDVQSAEKWYMAARDLGHQGAAERLRG
ncbi:hypothetical protein BKA56DRAFT_575214 [Ilyonectria sp. MPI-CAGE-AT-0026]|nr:hypothetical protein BKA56DRAFT_575214 [Ilyonectria sp. MPI-CAGE-AT-0026]